MPIVVTRPIIPPTGDPGRTFSMRLFGPNDEIQLTAHDPEQNGYYLTRGSQGLDLPRTEIFSDPLPGDDGDYYRGMRYGTREIFLPILTYGRDQPEARARQRRLFALLNPKANGPLTLEIAQYDGTARRIDGKYTGGAEGDWGSNWSRWWQLVGVNIRCFDPYFYDSRLRSSYLYAVGETGSPLVSTEKNFFPMRLSGAGFNYAEVPIDNPGDVDAFPEWTFTGPYASVEVTCIETGKSFTLGSAAADEQVVVKTARPLQSVKNKLTNENLWSKVEPGSQLFSVRPGPSTLNINMQTTAEQSAVQLDWVPRYLVA